MARDVCGGCGERADYYETYPRCSQCQEPTCEACHVLGSVHLHEYDHGGDAGYAVEVYTVTCKACELRNRADDLVGEPVEDPDDYANEQELVAA